MKSMPMQQNRDDYEKAHTCPKPLHDCREIVRRYTLEGALVVDCFCGVGSIPLAV